MSRIRDILQIGRSGGFSSRARVRLQVAGCRVQRTAQARGWRDARGSEVADHRASTKRRSASNRTWGSPGGSYLSAARGAVGKGDWQLSTCGGKTSHTHPDAPSAPAPTGAGIYLCSTVGGRVEERAGAAEGQRQAGRRHTRPCARYLCVVNNRAGSKIRIRRGQGSESNSDL